MLGEKKEAAPKTGAGTGYERTEGRMNDRQLSWRQRGALWLRLGIRLALFLLAIWLLRRFGGAALSLLAPFLAALVAAAILHPAVQWFERKTHWSRSLLAGLLLVALLAILGVSVGLLGYAAGNELVSLAQNWGGLLARLQSAVDGVEALFAQLWTLVPPQWNQSMQSVTDGLLDWLNTATPGLLNTLLDYTTDKAMGLPAFVVAAVICIMATFFLTADYPRLRDRAVRQLDPGLLHFLGQVRKTALGAFGGYLKAEFLLSVGVFFILGVGFWLTGQTYGLLLALGLAVLDFIPIIGAGTVMVPWAVVAFLTQDYRTAASLMAVWGVIVLFRRVMEPKFVGDQTGLSPILSLLSIYVGMKLGGVGGMILGPVVALVLLNLVEMGLFTGLRADVDAAAADIAAILSQRPEKS